MTTHSIHIYYSYMDTNNRTREGDIGILSINDPVEMILQANGYSFHIIYGSQSNGWFLCIPEWNIGSELADPEDEFWNNERLTNETSLHTDNIRAVTRALAVANRWIRDNGQQQ